MDNLLNLYLKANFIFIHYLTLVKVQLLKNEQIRNWKIISLVNPNIVHENSCLLKEFIDL